LRDQKRDASKSSKLSWVAQWSIKQVQCNIILIVSTKRNCYWTEIFYNH